MACADLFGLQIRNQDVSPGGNMTRFIVLSEKSRCKREPTACENTLISFLPNENDLSKCMQILAQTEVVRIDSRPVQNWYVKFI
jgi:prephenate dehydratase